MPMGFLSEDWGPVGKPSIGLAQVQVATARFIEEQGYMPATSGWNIPLIGLISGSENMARKTKLEDNGINAMYAAAYLKYFQDQWDPAFPSIANRPDILASLYNLGPSKQPNANPSPNDFGEDVLKLYPLMAQLLGGCGDGDIADCVPLLDQIAKASSTVFFGGLPAARKGDTTCHGGVIAEGDATVLLGD
ncbi:PAAR domain-containing protein [Chondromyces crocatus]